MNVQTVSLTNPSSNARVRSGANLAIRSDVLLRCAITIPCLAGSCHVNRSGCTAGTGFAFRHSTL